MRQTSRQSFNLAVTAMVLGVAAPALMADALAYPYYTHYAYQASNNLQQNVIGQLGDPYPPSSTYSNNVQQTSYSGAVSTSVPGQNDATAATSVSVSPDSLALISQTTGGATSYEGNSVAFSEVDIGFFDTLSVLGPSGQLGQFKIDLTLNSSISGDIFTGYSNSFVPYGGVYFLYDNVASECSGCVSPIFGFRPSETGLQTLSWIVSLDGGSQDPIGESLWLRNDYVPSDGLTISAQTTLTITPLTPGFSFTSASGSAYEGILSTPEPSTAALVLSALVVALWYPFQRWSGAARTNIS